MQTSSADFADAMASGVVTWDKTQVYVDWDDNDNITASPVATGCACLPDNCDTVVESSVPDDFFDTIAVIVDGDCGVATVDAIDDLTDIVGGPINVKQSLDDGLPTELTTTQNFGISEASIVMSAGSHPGGTHTITYRDFVTVSNGASTETSATVGSPMCRVGDLLIMAVSVSVDTATIESPSAEWKIAIGPTIDVDNPNTIVYWKRADKEDVDGTTYTVTFSGVNRFCVGVLALYSDGGFLRVGDTAGAVETVAGTTHVGPNVIASETYSVLLGVWVRGHTTGGTWTPDALDTELFDIRGTNVTTNVNLMVSLSDILPPGLHSRTATTSTASTYATMQALILEVTEFCDMMASQYFSTYREDSPLCYYPRDIAPMTVCVGAVTDAGRERVRIFTGQIADTPIDSKNRTATVEGVSATRFKLSTKVTYPIVDGADEGLETTFPIVYALHKCGLYVNPAPRGNCRLWAPMAGSLRTCIPDTNEPLISGTNFHVYRFDALVSQPIYTNIAVPFIDGPFARTPHIHSDDRYVYEIANAAAWSFGDGEDILSQAGNKGRLEMWVKAEQWGTAESGPASGVDIMHFGIDEDPHAAYVDLSILPNGTIDVEINDGVTIVNSTSVTAIPIDEAWHRIGFAWNVDAKTAYTYIDGVEESFVGLAINSLNLPVVDNDFRLGFSAMYSLWPITDLHLNTGDEGDPTRTLWMDEIVSTGVWVPSAVVDTADVQMNAILSWNREAWDIITEIARTEIATVKIDECDVFSYLGRRHWARDAQQLVVDTLDTSVNVGEYVLNQDVTRIRNSAIVDYTLSYTAWADTPQRLLNASVVNEVPPGSTIALLLPADMTIICPLDMWTPILPVDPAIVLVEPATYSFMTVNTANDGTGTYDDGTNIIALINWYDASTFVITVENVSGVPYFIVNDAAWSTLVVYGIPFISNNKSLALIDPISITDRGGRTLQSGQPLIQREEVAERYAQYIVDWYSQPRARIDNAIVFADPRRQSGDLVRFVDEQNTGIDTICRVTGIQHMKNGPTYTQSISLLEAELITGVVETSLPDNTYDLTAMVVDGVFVVAM